MSQQWHCLADSSYHYHYKNTNTYSHLSAIYPNHFTSYHSFSMCVEIREPGVNPQGHRENKETVTRAQNQSGDPGAVK